MSPFSNSVMCCRVNKKIFRKHFSKIFFTILHNNLIT